MLTDVLFTKDLNQPIGIFDSGVGGLTVASAIKKKLPGESFIYFGDTRHSPYGEKSAETIRRYSDAISRFLLSHNCKALVIACNTASALAYTQLKKDYPHVPIINVIDPVVEYVARFEKGKIGIIATRATTSSGEYKKRLLLKNPNLSIEAKATPLLVGLVEEGFIDTDLSKGAIKAYLNNKRFSQLDALILGCTHFPLLQPEIEAFYGGETTVIDSPELVAEYLDGALSKAKLLSTKKQGDYRFYVSEKTPAFSRIAKNFFGENITLKEKVL